MPKFPQMRPNERVDLVDFGAVFGYARESDSLLTKKNILDRQSRIIHGFRVEIPDQNTYPGRVVIHGGASFRYDGRMVFNEDQLDVTKSVTLDAPGTTYWLEIEFVEANSDVDARAFWDPTVENGTDVSGDALPDGEEFSANVATRKTMDWQIVTPIRTGASAMFERDVVGTLSSLRIPLIRLATDGSGKINSTGNPSLTTEKAASILLRQISTTQTVVRDASLFVSGQDIFVTAGGATQELATLSAVDIETGLLTHSVINFTGDHQPGDIIRATGTGTADYVTSASYGRYYRDRQTISSQNDWRDTMYQGDEVHGDVLSRSLSSPTGRSDMSLESLKDHVDFLAAQIQELKWGSLNPWDSGTSARRIPPGLLANFPTVPRHYDRAGGVMGARTAAVTVGDGVNSWGDFNGATQAVLQAAHDALPAAGGKIILKRGSYHLTADFNWTSTGSVTFEGENGTTIIVDGGRIHVATTGSVTINNLIIQGGTSNVGILVDTSNPGGFMMDTVLMTDAAFYLNAALPATAVFHRVWFWGIGGAMSAIPLFKVSGTNGVISGNFAECDFNHFSMLSLTCSLIDGINGAPTQAFNYAKFNNCTFTTALLNFESINLGTNPNLVHFNKCMFWGWLIPCHVRATGGNNIKFIDCIGADILIPPSIGTAFFQGSTVNHLEISGYVDNNPIGWPTIDLTDCSHVKITKCDLVTTSGTALGNSAIKVTSASGDINDYLIEGNTISGDYTTNNSMGFLFAITGDAARVVSNVIIRDNNFRYLETGGCFSNPLPAAVGTYKNIEIVGNQFRDSPSGAINFKLGLLFGDRSSRNNVNISDNTFDELNPPTTNTVSGNPRSAICILGSNNYEFTINNNLISKVGATGFELPNTAAIYFTSLGTSTISNNTIETVIGKGGFGILGVTGFTNGKICNNTLTAVNTVTGGVGLQSWAVGIYMLTAINVSVTGNVCTTIYGPSSGTGVGIATLETAGSWTNVTITGNSFLGNFSSVMRGVEIGTSGTVNTVTISGNTGYFMDIGVYIAATGGNYDHIAITGNTLTGGGGIIVALAMATTRKNVSITGNTLNTGSYDSIMIQGINGVTVSGNNVSSTAAKNNIIVIACQKTSITGNYLYTIDVASPLNSACNVNLSDSSNVVYIVSDNICDRNVVLGGMPNASILTFGSGNTVVGQGLVCDNMIRTVVVGNPADSFHDVGAVFP